jgi:hypothetical protein
MGASTRCEGSTTLHVHPCNWPSSGSAEDLSGVPVEQLLHVGVAMTVVGGEVVYEA